MKVTTRTITNVWTYRHWSKVCLYLLRAYCSSSDERSNTNDVLMFRFGKRFHCWSASAQCVLKTSGGIRSAWHTTALLCEMTPLLFTCGIRHIRTNWNSFCLSCVLWLEWMTANWKSQIYRRPFRGMLSSPSCLVGAYKRLNKTVVTKYVPKNMNYQYALRARSLSKQMSHPTPPTKVSNRKHCSTKVWVLN